MILIDTGPLVALFNPQDSDHKNCRRILQDIATPLFTTEAVLTEVFHYPLELVGRAVLEQATK